MTFILGLWSFDGNGSTGKLRITSIDPNTGTLEVSVQFDELARIDPWTGSWDDVSKHIVLTRTLPSGAVQNHDGYLGDNNPNKLILAGSFTESDIPSTAPRTRFGWFANDQTNIII
jgi:hypothetical protein